MALKQLTPAPQAVPRPSSLQVLVGKFAGHVVIDRVVAKRLLVLLETKLRGANRRCPSSVPWALVSGSF